MNNSIWISLHSLSADSMITGDLDGNGQDEVIIDFGEPYNFWIRMNNSSWVPFLQSAEFIVIGDLDGNDKDDVIISFNGTFVGIWAFLNNNSWIKLHNKSAQRMVTGNIDGLPSLMALTNSVTKLPAELQNTASLPKD